MNYQFPHTIENLQGEKLIFLRMEEGAGGPRVLVENFVEPGFGPPMHTHFLQEEALTVVKGRIGYLVKGQQPQFAEAGETVVFKPGVAHRFWNAGDDVLHCKGYITPAHTIVFFLSSIFAAQNKTRSPRPAMFDGAYLMTRYAAEYSLELPWMVKKVIVPVTYYIGKLLGKYGHFKDAPQPVKP
jgi:quercetin dioxygenase-like cupin family protein